MKKPPKNYHPIYPGSNVLIKTYETPPLGFDPLTASDSLLKRYGIVPRPDKNKTPELFNHWQNAFAKKSIYTAPQFKPKKTGASQKGRFTREGKQAEGQAPVKVVPFKEPKAPPPNSGVTTFYNPNNGTKSWAGYILNMVSPPADPDPTSLSGYKVSTFGGFTSIYGSWTVPLPVCPLGATPGQNFSSCAWIGLDGYNQSSGLLDIIQLGTQQDVTCTTPGVQPVNPPSYFAWFEWGPGGEQQLNTANGFITNLPVNTGDEINCFICLKSPQIANFYIKNNTTGHYISFSIILNLALPQGATPTPYVTGYCAEWILEDPIDIVTNELLPFANYGSITFTNCYAILTTPGYAPDTIYSCQGTDSVATLQTCMIDPNYPGKFISQASVPDDNDAGSFTVTYNINS